jgi:hypothetical protein
MKIVSGEAAMNLIMVEQGRCFPTVFALEVHCNSVTTSLQVTENKHMVVKELRKYFNVLLQFT